MAEEKVLASETYELVSERDSELEALKQLEQRQRHYKALHRVEQVATRGIGAVLLAIAVFITLAVILELKYPDEVDGILVIVAFGLLLGRITFFMNTSQADEKLTQALIDVIYAPDSRVDDLQTQIDVTEELVLQVDRRLTRVEEERDNQILQLSRRFDELEEQLSSIDTQEADKADERWDSLVQSVENLVHAEVLRQGTADRRKADAELTEPVAVVSEYERKYGKGKQTSYRGESEGSKKPGGSTT